MLKRILIGLIFLLIFSVKAFASPDIAPHNMTNNSSPSPYVTACSSYYSSYNAFYCFDGNWGMGQWWEANSKTGWISLDLGSGNYYSVSSYDVQMPSPYYLNRCPKDWTFEGSNDNSSWNVVDTVTGETGWSIGELRTYTCDVTGTGYRYYRMNISANNGNSSFVLIGELNIYGDPTSPPGPSAPVSLSGKFNMGMDNFNGGLNG